MPPPQPGTAPVASPPVDPAELRRLFFRVFPAVALAMFGAALDQTMVAAALPAIARGLGEVERVSWVVVLYLVANTVAAPVYGRLGDAFGRQRMLLVGLAVYGIGGTLCAFATSLPMLAAFRVVQGFGGGGLISLSVALIAEVVPARERGRFQAYIAAVFTTASALGPVFGGQLAEHFGWRSIFMLQLPLSCLAAWLAVARLGNASKGSVGNFRFDWWGLLLFSVFVAPALMALDQARRLSAGPLLVAAVLACIAGLALLLLLRWEKVAPDPLLPLALLGNATVWRANLMSSSVAGAFVGCIAFLPIYFTSVRGLSTGEAGLMLLPLSACAGIGAMISGALLARTGLLMRWPGIGLSLSATMLVLVTLNLGWLPLPLMSAMLGLVSIGFGMAMPMVQVAVQVAAGGRQLGSATASVQFTRSLGAATGTALLGAVLFGSLTLTGGEATRLFVALINQGPAALSSLDAAVEAGFHADMRGAFRAVFATAAVLVLFGAWMSTRVPLRRV